jgi:hypothetical protein
MPFPDRILSRSCSPPIIPTVLGANRRPHGISNVFGFLRQTRRRGAISILPALAVEPTTPKIHSYADRAANQVCAVPNRKQQEQLLSSQVGIENAVEFHSNRNTLLPPATAHMPPMLNVCGVLVSCSQTTYGDLVPLLYECARSASPLESAIHRWSPVAPNRTVGAYPCLRLRLDPL